MNRKNTLIGATLIFLGISIWLRGYHIRTGSLLTLFLGLGLLYVNYIKKEQPYAIFGGIFTAIGLISVINEAGLFHINIGIETLLIIIGIIFIFLYRTREVQGLIFPGMILPAIGIYLILQKSFDSRYANPSIFLLLGFAFYIIYFIAYTGKFSWTLVPATAFLLIGIIAYAFSFRVITWDMIIIHKDYIWPLLMILAGALILLNLRKK
ncbi:MAG TPA: hypothetical protein PLL98_09160 [Bacillota bacterium]|nr:hypothetical protein [Bacillota bacterium]